MNTNVSLCPMTYQTPGKSPYIQIISGNQHNIFALDAKNRMLLIKKRLTDYTGNLLY